MNDSPPIRGTVDEPTDEQSARPTLPAPTGEPENAPAKSWLDDAVTDALRPAPSAEAAGTDMPVDEGEHSAFPGAPREPPTIIAEAKAVTDAPIVESLTPESEALALALHQEAESAPIAEAALPQIEPAAPAFHQDADSAPIAEAPSPPIEPVMPGLHEPQSPPCTPVPDSGTTTVTTPGPVVPGIGVLLVNLGTPDAPNPAAVRRYLKEFLSDPRVIEKDCAALANRAQRHHPAAAVAPQSARLSEDLEPREERVATQDHHALAG